MRRRKPDSQSISKRRSMLKLGIGLGILPVTGAVYSDSKATTRATPSQTKGPFYPVHRQLDKDADLTRIDGRDSVASGEIIGVLGRVMSPAGEMLGNAQVEIWQADTNGRYRHPRDPNPATLDPNFQGWGISVSDEQGRYRFQTILPAAYPAGPGWMRPPHIHFKIVRQNFKPLVTQMYFPGNSYNDADMILQHLSPQDQQLVISKQVESDEGFKHYQFDIILEPAG